MNSVPVVLFLESQSYHQRYCFKPLCWSLTCSRRIRRYFTTCAMKYFSIFTFCCFSFFFFFHYHWTLMWLIHRTAYYKHQLIPSWVRKSIQSSSLYAKLGLLFFPLCSTLYLLPPNFTCCFTIKSLSSMMCHCNSSTSSLIITISYSIIGVFGLPRCITQHHHTWAVFPLGEFGQLSISMTTFYCKQQ